MAVAVKPALIQGDPIAAAHAAALRYVHVDHGIARRRRGKAFSYIAPDGAIVRDPATLRRIRALAIPPAWTDVVIAPSPAAHIQAIGRDARGRKQYRYHPRWIEIRDAAKYGRLVAFCHALPRLRAAVARDLDARGLPKHKVCAALVALLESCQLRIGNDEYARQNGSYGATTLRNGHAHVRGGAVELVFRAKGGIVRHVRVTDRRLVRIVRDCRALPGARLFQYVDERGRPRAITSADVNAYIAEHTRGPFTAKDFRTWAATLSAAALLSLCEHPATARACKSEVKRVLESVAQRLGHTPAVCRKSYVHPQVVDDFTTGHLAHVIGTRVRRACDGATIDEADRITVETLRAIEPIVARYLERAAPAALRAARRTA
jgi:DNA topoisomerase-1